MVRINPDQAINPRESVPTGHMVTTPGETAPYKAVFQIDDAIISEHPVASMREGEALIREELPNICVSAKDPHRVV